MITKALFTRAGRPGKLRTQVLIGVLVITLGALAVFDVAAVTALRTYLLAQTDGTLKSALSSTRPQLPDLLPDFRKQQSALNLPVYGAYYIAFVPVRGAVVNLQGGPGLKPPIGSAVAKAGAAQAALGARAKASGKIVTAFVGIPQYRVWSVAVPALSGTLVAGTNLKNVDATVGQLRLIVASGSAAADGACGDGGRILVEVSDNGPGVPADRLPRIFDRFYRAGTPANRPGSGLGLAIVTEIAAAHDGTVTAAPGWPGGLRVTLAVPAWREPGSADARAGQVELAENPA